MNTEQKKFKELMYLSLVSNFSYVCTRDSNVYLAFSAPKVKASETKKVYLTTLNEESDVLVNRRLRAFEREVMCAEFNKEYRVTNLDEKISYTKRIKSYLEIVYKNANEKDRKFIMKRLDKNLLYLCDKGILTHRQGMIAMSYMQEQVNKLKNNERTK